MIVKGRLRHIDTEKNVVLGNDVENGISHFETINELFSLVQKKRTKIISNIKSYNLLDYSDNTLNNNVLIQYTNSLFTNTEWQDILNWREIAKDKINGAGTVVDENIAIFDGTEGNNIKDSGIKIANLAYTSAGVVTLPTLVQDINDVIVGTGLYRFYDTVTGDAFIRNFEVLGDTFEITNEYFNYYIYANYNAGTPNLSIEQAHFNTDNGTTKIAIYKVSRIGSVISVTDFGNTGTSLANKIDFIAKRSNDIKVISGFSVIESTNIERGIYVDSITCALGATIYELSDVDSNTYAMLYYHVTTLAGGLTSTNINQLPNNTYFNGSDLVTLSSGKYAVYFVYRNVEQAKKIFIVPSIGEFDIIGTQTAQPYLFGEMYQNILLAKVIIKQGQNNIFSIQSAKEYQFTPNYFTVQEQTDYTETDNTKATFLKNKPDLSVYVPYNGATQNVDFGIFDIISTNVKTQQGTVFSNLSKDILRLGESTSQQSTQLKLGTSTDLGAAVTLTQSNSATTNNGILNVLASDLHLNGLSLKDYNNLLNKPTSTTYSHNSLSDLQSAANGVTLGHITDTIQSIKGEKTFLDNFFAGANANVQGNLTIVGEFFVKGRSWVVEGNNVSTKDNIIILNEGEVNSEVTAGTAGLEIDRGSGINYFIGFDDVTDTPKAGFLGSLKRLAFIQDTPLANGIAKWNSTEGRLDTISDTFYLATTQYTASDILTKIKTVDGSGSGLDADLLDGQDSTYFLNYNNLTNKPTNFVPYTGATGSLDMGSNTVTATQLISTVATGTAPLVVASITPVANLGVYNALYLRKGANWQDANIRPAELGTNISGVYSSLNTTGSTNYPSVTGNPVLFERFADWSNVSSIGSFMLWASNTNNESLFFRKLTASNNWSSWFNFWHSGNSGTITTPWVASTLGVGISSPNRLFEVLGGADATETVVAQFRSNFFSQNTSTTIRIVNSANGVSTLGVDLTALRTDVGGAGSTDFIVKTSTGSVMTERFRIKHNGKVENARTLTTTTGSGTYNLDFSANNEYIRTITAASTLTCSNGVQNDVFFIKVTGNFILSFGAGITVLGGATYDGSKGAYIGIRCVSTGVYYAKIQNFS